SPRRRGISYSGRAPTRRAQRSRRISLRWGSVRAPGALRQQVGGDAADQPLGVDRGAHLGVVVEVEIDVAATTRCGASGTDAAPIRRLAALRPGDQARRPPIERRILVAAGLELPRAVQPGIDEFGGEILQVGPLDGV